MIKYVVILAVNLFLLYCITLFFIDNRILTKDPFVIVRNLVVFSLALWISYNLVSIYVLRNQTPESALVYKVASKTKAYGLGLYEHILPFKKELIIWSGVAFGFMILGVITVGITGYMWLIIPVKLGWVREITGDAAWPAAVLMALAWPLLLPVAVLVKHQLIRQGYPALATPGFWGVVAGGIVFLVWIIYLTNRNPVV